MVPMSRTVNFQLLLISLFLSSVLGRQAHANTVKAVSCSVSDVQAAINSANDGDTVVIPNASCSWSSGITFSKQIVLQGETAGGVTITDVDTNSNDSLLTITTGASFHTTLANITFLPGSGKGHYVTIQGSGLPPLMHDMTFNLPNFQLQNAVNWWVTGGVIWNTTFISTSNLSGACGTQVGSDSGSLAVRSNLSWNAPSTMGVLDTTGTNNLYIEDTVFSNVGQIPDLDDNARVVIRHSQIIGSSGLTHGPTGAQGGRSIEFYNDTFSYPNQNRPLNRYFWMRAGTMVVTNNDIQWINGGCYPNKNSFTVIVEGARWNTGGHQCCTGWQCWHQVGSGASSVTNTPPILSASQSPTDNFQMSDPVYIWNNRGTGQGSSHYGTNEVDPAQDNCHNINPSTGQEFSTTDFYKAGRDYFYDDTSNPNNGARPGWAPYPYPHPLRGNSSTPPPAPPTGVTITVK
jgi:hypothetical protein